MSKLVNLRSAEKPLLMEVENIAVISEHFKSTFNEGKTVVSFSDKEQGHFLQVGEDWDVTATDAVTKIRAADIDLFEVPLFWGDKSKQEGNYFINPALVQAIITSDPFQIDGDSYESVYLLVDVKGYGRVESTKVPVALVEGLIKEVSKHVPDMLHFDSSEYSTRFSGDKGFTMFDPREVRDIHPNGYDLDIKFNDGNRLDFHMDSTRKLQGETSKYVNRIIKRLMGKNTDIQSIMDKVDGDLNNLLPRAYKYEERQRKKMRADFAAAVAPHVPGLLEIEGAADVYYVRPENISWITQHKDMLSVQFKKKAGQQYGDDMHVYYRSEEAATKGAAKLAEAINTAPAPKP